MDLKIAEFFHDIADRLLGEEPPEDTVTYNSSQVGAGLMALKQRLEEAPEIEMPSEELDKAFAQIHLTNTMSKEHISQSLKEIGELTNLPPSIIANTVIDTVENGDFNVNLMHSIRFGQLQEQYCDLSLSHFQPHDENIPH